MLGDILLLFRIRMTRKVNGFFYYFKKLPLIGRLLKESCYAAVNLKGVECLLLLGGCPDEPIEESAVSVCGDCCAADQSAKGCE